MTAEDNKALARRLFEEGFSQGKVDVVDEVLDPNFVCYDPNSESGEVRGRDIIKGEIEYFRNAVPGSDYTHCLTPSFARVRLKRDPQPSAGIVDSQSVKTTAVGGGERGCYDGGKKVKGRKRHLLVDTQALVLKAKVHVANVVDQEGIKPLLDGAKKLFPRLLSHLWMDAGYRGEEKGREAGWRRCWGGRWTSSNASAQTRSRGSSSEVVVG